MKYVRTFWVSASWKTGRNPRFHINRRIFMPISALITGIAHIGIRVHALDRARVFYEFLGFNFVIGPIGPEPVAIM